MICGIKRSISMENPESESKAKVGNYGGLCEKRHKSPNGRIDRSPKKENMRLKQIADKNEGRAHCTQHKEEDATTKDL